MLESLKAWLLSDPSGELTGFRFEFNVPMGLAPCLLLLLAAALGVSLYYWPRISRLPKRLRVFIVGLRAAIVALALFMLLDPCIVAHRVRPGDRYVVLLHDNSMSMKIEGSDGRSRGKRLVESLDAAKETFQGKLERKFRVAPFSFGDGLAPIKSAAALDFEGRESDLLGSIEGSLRELEGIDVAAVVLFSDGVQQADRAGPDALKSFSCPVPVFAVGVDSESQWRDIEVGKLMVSRTNFDQSPVTLTAPIRAVGLAGNEAVVEVLLGDRVIKRAELKIAGDDEERETRIEFVPQEKDWLDYQVRVRLADAEAPKPGEAEAAAPGGQDRVPQNNARRFVVDNREKSYRILYFSARPNWENKFVRRAVEDDKELRLTSLLAISRPEKKFVFRGKKSSGTANPLFEGFEGERGGDIRWDEAVFLRLGVTGAELEKGYPSLPEDLYPYHLLVWGEVDCAFFSREQLELTRDFVRKRGGAMLLMGGAHSFTEGHCDGTPIEAMLPALLRPSAVEDSQAVEALKKRFAAKPTLEGALSGAWSLDPDPETDKSIWDMMPPLAGLNSFSLVRPGATVWARVGDPDGPFDGSPLFMLQRYGEGTCAAMATGVTWPWQLDPNRKEEEKADEDNPHARVWRQMVRSLVKSVPEQVLLRDKADTYPAGQKARFEAIVRDKLFEEREGLRATIKAISPSGREILFPVDESIHEPGLYAAEFTPAEPGLHRLSVEAITEKDEVVAKLDEAFLAEPDLREFQDAQFNGGFLKELAEKTGGNSLSLDQLPKLADMIPWDRRDESNEVRLHLWRFPGFFAALVVMLAIEWYQRRRKGYA